MEERFNNDMAYETKVILSLIAEGIAKAQTVKAAYQSVVRAANVEGVKLPSYEEMKAELDAENSKE